MLILKTFGQFVNENYGAPVTEGQKSKCCDAAVNDGVCSKCGSKVEKAEAEVKRSEGEAKAIEIKAKATAEATELTAGAEANRIELTGKAEATKIEAIGKATADAYEQQVKAMGPENFAKFKIIEEVGKNNIKLIPEILITGGGDGNNSLTGLATIEMLNYVKNNPAASANTASPTTAKKS